MVYEILEVFVGSFCLPIPFFFVAYSVRQLMKYFTAAANIPTN